MNFYDSLTYNWAFARLYGLNYFTNHQNELKITNISLIRSLIPGLGFIIFFSIGMLIIRPDESDYNATGVDNIIYVVGQIGIVVQFSTCTIIFIASFTHRKDLIKFYETVFKLDDILLNELKISLDYRKMKAISSRRLFTVQTIYCIISCIIDYAYASNQSYIVVLVVYNFSAAANLMNSLEFINGTKIIKIRFKYLNDLLARTHHLVPNDLEVMIECHLTLNRLIISMNEIYGSRQISSITNDFVIIIVQLYSFFVAVDNSFDGLFYVKFLYGLLMLPSLMSKTFFTSTNCQRVVCNKNDFGKLLRKFENSKITREISNLVCYMYSIIYLILYSIYITIIIYV